MADSVIWNRYFPSFIECREPDIEPLLQSAKQLQLEAGEVIFQPGEKCGNYLLVLEGSVRVHLLTPSGREVLIYRVEPGNACILTTSCLLGGNDYPAFGMTETPVKALAITGKMFHQALAQSPFFRNFVFSGFAERLSNVIFRMEELMEGDVDRMLAKTLLALSDQSDRVKKTHQEIAAAIGSAREVVSRHLKRFEANGWVRLGRGQVEILDRHRLVRMGGT